MFHKGKCTLDDLVAGCTSDIGLFTDSCDCSHKSYCSDLSAPGYACTENQPMCAPGYELRSTFITEGDKIIASASQYSDSTKCFEFCATIEQ